MLLKKILPFLMTLALVPSLVQGQSSVIRQNRLKLGRGTATDIYLEFDKGSGATNPKMRWNNSTSRIEISSDGTLYAPPDPLTTKGDLYGFTSTVDRFPIGSTNGMSLFVDSAQSFGMKWGFNEVASITNADSPYTVPVGTKILLVNASGGAVTVNLPTAANTGHILEIYKTDSSANLITLDPNGAQTIAGQSTIKMSGFGDYVKTIADGTNIQTPQAYREAHVSISFGAGSSTINYDPFNVISTAGLVSAGSATLTLVTGIFSSTPTTEAAIRNGGARLEKFTALPSSATSITVYGRESASTSSATTIQDATAMGMAIVMFGAR